MHIANHTDATTSPASAFTRRPIIVDGSRDFLRRARPFPRRSRRNPSAKPQIRLKRRLLVVGEHGPCLPVAGGGGGGGGGGGTVSCVTCNASSAAVGGSADSTGVSAGGASAGAAAGRVPPRDQKCLQRGPQRRVARDDAALVLVDHVSAKRRASARATSGGTDVAPRQWKLAMYKARRRPSTRAWSNRAARSRRTKPRTE